MTEPNVMLSFCHPGTVRTEFMKSVLAYTAPGSPVAEIVDVKSGPVMANARDRQAKQFLASSCDWLWIVDTDVAFSPQTLPVLLAHADPESRPVVGAVYYSVLDNIEVAMMFRASRVQDGQFMFGALASWPPSKLLQVDGTGCGCLLIHRSVFKRISENRPDDDELWFAEITIDRTLFGEDLSFCLRCAMAQIPVFVHTGVVVGHMKTNMLGEVSP